MVGFEVVWSLDSFWVEEGKGERKGEVIRERQSSTAPVLIQSEKS